MEQTAKYPAEGIARAQREKTWEECSAEERMERLRETARFLGRMARILNERLDFCVNIAADHEHGANGRVLTNPHRAGAGQALSGGQAFDPLA